MNSAQFQKFKFLSDLSFCVARNIKNFVLWFCMFGVHHGVDYIQNYFQYFLKLLKNLLFFKNEGRTGAREQTWLFAGIYASSTLWKIKRAFTQKHFPHRRMAFIRARKSRTLSIQNTKENQSFLANQYVVGHARGK